MPGHRIDEHQCRGIAPEACRVHARVECAELVSDQHDWPDLVAPIEQDAQFLGHSRRDVAAVASLAPAEAGAIVAAHACRSGDFGLNPPPRGGHAAGRGLEDDDRRALAGAVNVQLMTARIDEPSWPWKAMPFQSGRNTLIGRAGQKEEGEKSSEETDSPPQAERERRHGLA